MAAHTYWRINVTANDGDSLFLAIAEVQMRATTGGADQCTGGTASASASDGSTPPGNAVDDDANTRWSTPSGTLTGWWQYEFASAVEVLEYTLQAHPTTPGRSPRDWTLEYSDDGTNWTVAETREDETGWTAGEIRTFTVTEDGVSDALWSQSSLEVMASGEPDALWSQSVVEALILQHVDSLWSQSSVEVMTRYVPTLAGEIEVNFTGHADMAIPGALEAHGAITFMPRALPTVTDGEGNQGNFFLFF